MAELDINKAEELEKKYDKSGYMQQYGGSVILAFLILIIIGFGIFRYVYISKA